MRPPDPVALGVLAGGRGSRVGGVDKAWIPHGGRPLLQRALDGIDGPFAERLVAARAHDPRHAPLGVRAVLDLRPGFAGPLAGLEALAAACRAPWLLTVPVDVDGLPRDVAARLWAARAENGAVLADGLGLQPLVALWSVAALRGAVPAALDAGRASARALVAALALPVVDIAPVRLANRNTPEDL